MKPVQTLPEAHIDCRILTAGRSWSNECQGKEMHSCIASGGTVECYFPTKAAHDRNAALFAAARELLAACKQLLSYVEMKLAHAGAQSVAEIMRELQNSVPMVSEISTGHHIGCSTTTRSVDLAAARAAITKATQNIPG